MYEPTKQRDYVGALDRSKLSKSLLGERFLRILSLENGKRAYRLRFMSS